MNLFSESTESQPETAYLRAARTAVAAAGFGIYLGHTGEHWSVIPPELSVMVLGPPRSGKTSSLIIPNVLASSGPVVSTSTKTDVLDATLWARSDIGRCYLFDPTSSVTSTGSLEALHWSPLQSCATWEGAVASAHSLVHVSARIGSRGTARADGSHWNERAQALLASFMYAAALDGADMRTVLAWVDRRTSLTAENILAAVPGSTATLALDSLQGITATDERELSGIWSTASGALSAYRTERALAVTDHPNFDPRRFVDSADSIYVCAPAHRQAMVAPMVVGLIEDVCTAAYERHAETARVDLGIAGSAGRRPPVFLALDELANIAPLPNLPSMISEGGGQGVVAMACLQDLSQGRNRWPDEADGFPSLFGTTVVLPGIGDVRTLEAFSTMAGDEEITTRTVSAGRAPSGHPLADVVTGGRPHAGESASTQWRRRLPPDLITRGSPGQALVFDHRNQPGWVWLAPAHIHQPWKMLTEAGQRYRRQNRDIDFGREH